MLTESQVTARMELCGPEDWACDQCGKIFQDLRIAAVGRVLCSQECLVAARREGIIKMADLDGIDM